MTNALTTFNPGQMTTALRKVSLSAQPSYSFLKMGKDGDWVHGAQQTAIPEDAEFLINPASFDHGYVAWNDGEKLGEIIVPITEALPELPPVPGGAKTWDFQLGFHLAGVDDGAQYVYRATSVGGKRVIAQVAALVAEKIEEGNAKCVPVVTLTSESYKHSKYGKIYNPVMDVVRWVAMPAAGDSKKDALAKAKAPAKKIAAKAAR